MTKAKSKKPSLKSQGVRLTAYVPQELKDDVDMLAIVKKTTSSELVSEAVQTFLNTMKNTTLTTPSYYEVTESKTIVRVIGTNPDGTLICDGLFTTGWWRLVPITPEHLAKNTTEKPDFVDTYPQEFLPNH